MKKIFLFIMCTALTLGLFLGIREYMLSQENVDVVLEESVDEVSFIPELKLPLIEVDTLNPIYTQNRQVANTLGLIYEPMIGLDENNKLVPMLAVEWNEKDDFTWIVKLRENVKWHSEKVFTAEDIKFTVNSILAKENSTYYENVKNIVNIDIIDNNTVVISLKEKDSFLPYKLNFPIIPKYYLFENLDNIEKLKRPIGTGAYTFQTHTDDEHRITLNFNNNWWNTNYAKLKTIYLYTYTSYGEAIKAFKSAEIDVISTSMYSWKKKFGVIGINSYSYENSKFETLIPNTKNLALSESSVRRAILYAINRNNIVDDIYEGNASIKDIMIHDYSWLYDKNLNAEYNPEKAKQLLLNAGWIKGENGWQKNISNKTVKLSFNLLVNEQNIEKIKVAEKIKNNLNEIGIAINVKKVKPDVLTSSINRGEFDLVLSTISLQNEYDIVDLLLNKNYSKYENIEMKNLLNSLYIDNISIVEEYKKVQSKYREEVPYIGLYFKTDTLLTNKAVKGHIAPTWYNIYHNICSWCK